MAKPIHEPMAQFMSLGTIHKEAINEMMQLRVHHELKSCDFMN